MTLHQIRVIIYIVNISRVGTNVNHKAGIERGREKKSTIDIRSVSVCILIAPKRRAGHGHRHKRGERTTMEKADQNGDATNGKHAAVPEALP